MNDSDYTTQKEISVELFTEGLKAVEPSQLISNCIKVDGSRIIFSDVSGSSDKINVDDFNNVYMIGAGKASSAMAQKIEKLLGEKITSGIITTKHNFTKNLKFVDQTEAGHPLPDDNGFESARKILTLCENATEKDLIICVISGGASSLLVYPVDGVSLSDKVETTDLLLHSGATINEINVVRKHISQVKGGRLMQAAYPAKVISLIISDVIGDDLSTIGSGPFEADDTTFSEAIEIIKKHDLFDKIPSSVLHYLIEGKNGNQRETPQKENEVFSKKESFIVGNNSQILKRIKDEAEKSGYDTKIVNSQMSGMASEVGVSIAKEAVEFLNHGAEEGKKYCLLYGGETTVNVTGNGKGGRNQELVLSASIELAGKSGISLLSCGTDGNDGPTDAAGAFSDWNTSERGSKNNLDPRIFLKNNDS